MKFTAIFVAAIASVNAISVSSTVASQAAELQQLTDRVEAQEKDMAKIKSIFDTIKGLL